jgi:hypothetical protein
MAAPTTARFGAGYIEVETRATPGTFTKVCGFNEIEIALDKDLNDTTVPDCDNPDAAAWVQRDVVSRSATFSCSGVAAKVSLSLLDQSENSDLSSNIRITIGGMGIGTGSPALVNRRYAGKFHTKHTLTGERGNKWQIEFSGESDGEVTITSVAAS